MDWLSNMSDRFLYVDCCNTLIKKDTYHDYFKYCSKKLGFIFFVKYFFVRILFKFGFIEKKYFMKILSKENINSVRKVSEGYVDEVLLPCLNLDVLHFIDSYRLDYKIVIVSGGVKEYLEVLSIRLRLDGVISASIYDEDLCLIVGSHKVEGIKLYEKKLGKGGLYRIGVGDSDFDIPMLDYTDESFLVSNSTENLKKIAKDKGWGII